MPPRGITALRGCAGVHWLRGMTVFCPDLSDSENEAPIPRQKSSVSRRKQDCFRGSSIALQSRPKLSGDSHVEKEQEEDAETWKTLRHR